MYKYIYIHNTVVLHLPFFPPAKMASRSQPRPWRTGRRAGGSPDPGRGARRPRPQLPRLHWWHLASVGADLIPADPNVRMGKMGK